MKKKTAIKTAAIGAAVFITASALLIGGGIIHSHSEKDAQAQAIAAAKSATLSHMKHWDGYSRLKLKPRATDAELQAEAKDSAAASEELNTVAAQWVTKAEVKKITPILLAGGVITSVKALDDPIIYRWTTLGLTSVCQSIFDGQTKPSTVTDAVKTTNKVLAAQTKANNTAVQEICPELF